MRVFLVLIAVLGLLAGTFAVAQAQDGSAGRDKGIIMSTGGELPENTVAGLVFAVIVGINYEGEADIPPLDSAEKDAKKLYDTLLAVSGGRLSEERTTILTGSGENRATREAILEAIDNYAGIAGPLDTLVVYFSGHGIVYKGNNYLIPAGVSSDKIRVQALRLVELVEFLNDSKAAQKVILIDACHSAATEMSNDEIKAGRMAAEFMADLQNVQRGWAMVSSCDIEETSIESPELGGVFTYFLCEGLSTGKANYRGDPFITLDELYSYVYENVEAWCSQHADADMHPVKQMSVSGNIHLAVVDYQSQPVRVAEQVIGGQPGEFKVKELTLDGFQDYMANEDLLVKAKLLYYGVEEESTLNEEYLQGLDRTLVSQSVDDMETYLEANPDNPDAVHYLALGRMHLNYHDHNRDPRELRRGLNDNVLPVIDQAISMDPANPEHYILKAQVLNDTEDYAGCHQAALKAIDLNPDALFGYVFGTVGLAGDGRLNDALQLVNRGIDRFPENPHLWKFKADIYNLRSQFSSAIEPMLNAERLYREHGTSYYGTLVEFLFSLGDLYTWTDITKSEECYAQAMTVLKEHERDEADNPYFHAFYAMVAARQNDLSGYRRGVMRANEIEPDDADILWINAFYMIQIGNDVLAEKYLRRAIGIQPDNVQLWITLSALMTMRQDYLGAVEAIDRAIELAPEQWGLVIQRGGLYLRLGDHASAERDFDKALGHAPQDCDLINLVGVQYGNSGYAADAVGYYEKALAMKELPVYHSNLVLSNIMLMEYGKAKGHMDFLLSHYPGEPNYIDLAGQLANARGDMNAALEYFTEAASYNKNPVHIANLANLQWSLGMEAAEDTYTEMVDKFPDSVHAYNLRGYAYMSQSRWVPAATDFQMALNCVPEHVDARRNLSYCLSMTGEDKMAERLLREGIRDYVHPGFYVSLMYMYANSAYDEEKLEETYDTANGEFGDHPLLISALGDYEFGILGDIPAAIDIYKYGAELYPGSVVFQYSLGNCYFSQGDYETAAKYHKQFLRLNPSVAAYIEMVNMYTYAGQYEIAAKFGVEYMKAFPGNKALK